MKRITAIAVLLALLLPALACTREVEKIVVVTPTELPATATAQPLAAPTLPPTPPLSQAESQAPPAPLPDRTNCAEIKGTEYRSPTEREWYLANCVPTPGPIPQASSTLAIPGAVYAGTTSQGKPIRFTVSSDGQGISQIVCSYTAPCSAAPGATGLVPSSEEIAMTMTLSFSPFLPIRASAFSSKARADSFGCPGDEISGRFTSATTAEGTASFWQCDQAARCQTGSLTWTASAQ